MQGVGSVGVVLLNWNNSEDTLACVGSIMRGTTVPRIIVVDNGSEPLSLQKLKDAGPGFELVVSPVNVGFAEGCNIGLRMLLQDGVDFLWLLNNDTEVHPDCLTKLLVAMQQEPDIAACSAKILYFDRPELLWFAGGDLNWDQLAARHRGDAELDSKEWDRAGDVEFLSGCCMLMRREAVERVGILDSRLFTYWEDVDWCIRARSLGCRLTYVPDAVLWHKVSASFKRSERRNVGGSTRPVPIYLGARNRLLILRKHARTLRQKYVQASLWIVKYVFYMSGLLVAGRTAKAKAAFFGILDGLTHKVNGPPKLYCLNPGQSRLSGL